MTLHNKYTKIYPGKVEELFKHIKGEDIDATDTAVYDLDNENAKKTKICWLCFKLQQD